MSTAWLLHCLDPLGPQGTAPPRPLSITEAKRLLRKATAHGVLPIVMQNFPFPAGDDFQVLRDQADAGRIEQLALSTMLNHHEARISMASAALPVTIVKGRIFAETIYPKAALRTFTDIDLLADPGALPRLDQALLAQGFASAGIDGDRLEAKWVHSKTGALVEVHGNLVHSPRMRQAFSLAYADVGDRALAPSTQLAVAITHGAMHYFAWLRHVVDVCQAARAVADEKEEARFEAITIRSGTRVPALVGLALAFQLFRDERCLEIAKILSSRRETWIVRALRAGTAFTATSNSWLVYNTWRRYVFRELLRYDALKEQSNRKH
jgi:Uncharacterised nucleotidyltransferase